MKFESILTALVCLAVVLLLKSVETPTPAHAAAPVDVNCVGGPLTVETGGWDLGAGDCANGFCRRPFSRNPTPAPVRKTPGADADGSPRVERSILKKRTCETQVRKGPLRRLGDRIRNRRR